MLPCSSCDSAVGLTCITLARVRHARIGHADEIDLQVLAGSRLLNFSRYRCKWPIAPLRHVQLDFIVGVGRGNRHQHLARLHRPVLQLLFHVPGDDLARRSDS